MTKHIFNSKTKLYVGTFGLIVIILIASCGPKQACKTRSGKKKINHYNSIQYR